MPLLFKNGKLVINDIDQLVFSDDPDSCRCCPGACECPSGSDYAEPKYLDDINFAVTGFPATYTETSSERFRDVSARFFTDTLIVKNLSLSGFSGLNGTYPGTLLSAADGVTECEPPSPVPECPYDDTRVGCYWKINYPRVYITGSLSIYYLRVGNETGQDYRIETTDNYFVYGVASLGTGYSTTDNVVGGATVLGCFSSSPYGAGDYYRGFAMEFLDRPTLGDATVFQGSYIKTNCDPYFPSQWVTPDQLVKPIQLTTVPNLFTSGSCPGSLDYNPTRLGLGEFPWAFCSDPTTGLSSVNFSISDCAVSGSIGGPVLGVPFLSRFYDYSFTSDAFSFQYQWNPTILP